MSSVDLERIKGEFAQANREYSERREAALAFSFTVFYDGRVLDNTEGIRHFYETALPLIRDRITCFDVDGRMRYKRIVPRAFKELDRWLEVADPKRDNYGLIFESGVQIGDRSDGALHFYHSGTLYPGFLRLILTVEHASKAPEAMVGLAVKLTEKLKVLAGYGGYCLATYAYSGWDKGEPLYVLSRRFRGVDFIDPYEFREYHQFGIATENWLTWVGERWLEKLGGRAGIAARVEPPLVLHELPHGVLLQAGPEPLWGDVNRNESLDAYQAAGKLLKAARFPVETLKKYGPIGGSENTREWLQRFEEG